MKSIIGFLSIPLFLLGCGSSNESESLNSFELTNKLDLQRIDESVVIPFSSLESYIGSSSFKLIDSKDSAEIAYQLDDLDQDGQWDELALIANFKANETKTITIIPNEEPSVFPTRTNIHLGYSSSRNDTFLAQTEHLRPKDHLPQSKPWLYQFEGPGWENDKVAFRAYFDDRNGKDIFGKLTNEMVLSEVGLPIGTEEGNYHKVKPWGMDVLKVGPSLGAGALGMIVEDSLFRLTNTKKATFKIITEGPVRSIFELNYEGWDVKEDTFDLTERITIWAGQYDYTSEVNVTPFPEGKIVTGLVTMKTNNPITEVKNEHYAAISSFDEQQSENHDALGLAIISPLSSFDRFAFADSLLSDVKNSALVAFKGSANYKFVAGWGQSNIQLNSGSNFEELVKTTGERMSSPIVIEF